MREILLLYFLAGITNARIDGIYPVSGGAGVLTIYGSNLPKTENVRFRSEINQEVKCNVYR
jgi:hypothetical protein